MRAAPSVLVLGAEELGDFLSVLRRLEADFVSLRESEIPSVVEQPRDLLVTTCRVTLDMPRLESAGRADPEPAWICVHNQDFLPLRERLRGLGVHFLLHTRVDRESLRLLLLQLLYQGAERRGAHRLPVGFEVTCQVGSQCWKAQLAELAPDGGRIIADQEIPEGTPITLYLPPELDPRTHLVLEGHASHCRRFSRGSKEPAFSVVVHFSLDAESDQHLARLLEGRQLGTRVTPLEPAPRRTAAPSASSDSGGERRQRPRGEYARRVPTIALLHSEAPDVVLGRDLSLEGMRIAPHPDLEVGALIGVALHGSGREEPVVVNAEVIRDDGERGLALRFLSLSPEAERQLERLLGQLAPIEALREVGADPDPLVVSQLLRSPR